MPDTGINIGQWAITAWTGLLSLVLGKLWTEVSAVRGQIEHSGANARQHAVIGDDKLWFAIRETNERIAASNEKSEAFRAKMLETLRDVPTKNELGAMEARLTQLLDRQHR